MRCIYCTVEHRAECEEWYVHFKVIQNHIFSCTVCEYPSAIVKLSGIRKLSHWKVTWSPRTGNHSTSPPTRGVGHTQGQSGPTVCLTPIRDNTDDPNPLGGLHLFSTSSPPPSDFDAPKGSHTPTTAGRCGVSNPVQQLRKGVHRTNRENIGLSSKGI